LRGRWRLFESDMWDADYLDMEGPAHIRFDGHESELAFGCVNVSLDCSYARSSIHFNFEGFDEMTEVSGDGHATLEDDGTVTVEISFFKGDEASFKARRF
jgi:hypothetical protein